MSHVRDRVDYIYRNFPITAWNKSNKESSKAEKVCLPLYPNKVNGIHEQVWVFAWLCILHPYMHMER